METCSLDVVSPRPDGLRESDIKGTEGRGSLVYHKETDGWLVPLVGNELIPNTCGSYPDSTVLPSSTRESPLNRRQTTYR